VSRHRTQYQIMPHIVKKRLDVNLHHPWILPAPSTGHFQRIVRLVNDNYSFRWRQLELSI